LYDPQVVVVWNNQFQPHHLAIWAPYIAHSKYRMAIVCHSMKDFELISESLPNTPVWVLDRHVFALQQLPIAQSFRVFLYPDNERNNEHTVHNYPRHMHVHMGHGDSDKSASANRFGALYDFILLADKNAVDRYRKAGIEIPDRHYLPIGAPTIPDVHQVNSIDGWDNVLYAPTWEGTNPSKNFSSLGYLSKILVDQFKSCGLKFDVRMHGYLGARDITYKKLLEDFKNYTKKDAKKNEQFNQSDFILCDISGVLSEYLFTGKPIVLPVHSENHWLLTYIANTNLMGYVYLWNFDLHSLKDFIQSVKSDPLRQARLTRRDELYAGAANFKEAVDNFDGAIDAITLEHQWRMRRNGFQMDRVSPIPVCEAWRGVELSIRDGSGLLGV